MTAAALPTLPATGGVLCLIFALLWWRQTRTANATSVDAAWAVAIGVLGVGYAVLGDGAPTQRLLAGVMAGAWSGRLSWHLLRYRVFGHAHEDGRYRAMREHWGDRAQRYLFFFYQVQAGAAFVFALPFYWLADHRPGADDAAVAGLLPPLQWAGLALVVVAQLAEALADRQLEQHRNDPDQKGRTCRRGLWRYSRHPNYFFEWLSWCGIALVVTPAAGYLAWLQPVIMFVLVRFVSGVPYTEMQSIRSRGDDYRRYQRETSAFVPWFPRPAGEGEGEGGTT